MIGPNVQKLGFRVVWPVDRLPQLKLPSQKGAQPNQFKEPKKTWHILFENILIPTKLYAAQKKEVPFSGMFGQFIALSLN